MRTFKGGGSSAPTSDVFLPRQPMPAFPMQGMAQYAASGGRTGFQNTGATSQTITTTSLPEYLREPVTRLMQRGEAESLQGYTPYGGQRLAYFSPDELTSQAMARGFGRAGTPQQFTDASRRYGGQQSITGGFTQGDVSSGYTAGAVPQGYQSERLANQYQAGQFDPSYAARDVGPGYQGSTIGSGYQARGFDPGYTAQTRGSQYGVAGGPAEYSPLGYEENIQRFMSPYQQNVTDIEKREARRQSEISGKGIQDAATVSGGLGGFREAIMQAERERGLGQQLGDIQQRGSQAAFESAQQQLERERGSGAAAAQFGLQRFGAIEGAAQAQEQLAQASFNAGQSARQQAAQLGLSAQQQEDAARQAQEQYSQSAFGASQQAMQTAGSQELQSYQAGEAARQQAAQLGLSAQQQEDAARQAQEKFGQSAYSQTQQALQAQGAQGLQAYQAGESARQQAATLGLSAQQVEQAGRQAQEKFRQSAFDLSSRYNLQAAEGLMRSGQGIQQDVLSRMSILGDAGRQKRALQQAGLDMGYEDFRRQRDYTQKKIGAFGSLLHGVPLPSQETESTYEQQPGLFQTAIGAGLSGLGLYKGMGG